MQIKYSEMEFIFIELQKLIDATAPIKLSGVPDFSALQSIELPTAKEMAEQEIEICKLMKRGIKEYQKSEREVPCND